MSKQEQQRKFYHRVATPWCFWLQAAGVDWLFRKYCRRVLQFGAKQTDAQISALCYWHECIPLGR